MNLLVGWADCKQMYLSVLWFFKGLFQPIEQLFAVERRFPASRRVMQHKWN